MGWFPRPQPTNKQNSTRTVNDHAGSHNTLGNEINRVQAVIGDDILGPYTVDDPTKVHETITGLFTWTLTRLRDLRQYITDTVTAQLGDHEERLGVLESDVTGLTGDLSNLGPTLDSGFGYDPATGYYGDGMFSPAIDERFDAIESGGIGGGGGGEFPGGDLNLGEFTVESYDAQARTASISDGRQVKNGTGRGLFPGDLVVVLDEYALGPLRTRSYNPEDQ